MAYDTDLADRIRDLLQGEGGVTEKRMFGGLAFLVDGHMAVTASGRSGLMVRVDPEESGALVAREGVERMVMKGRAMDGWLHVEGGAAADDEVLGEWVERGVVAVRSLPST